MIDKYYVEALEGLIKHMAEIGNITPDSFQSPGYGKNPGYARLMMEIVEGKPFRTLSNSGVRHERLRFLIDGPEIAYY